MTKETTPFLNYERNIFYYAQFSNKPVDWSGNTNIYSAKKIGTKWSVPVILEKPINSSAEEAFPSVSLNQKSMFLTCTNPQTRETGIFWFRIDNGLCINFSLIDIPIEKDTKIFAIRPFPDEKHFLLLMGNKKEIGKSYLAITKQNQENEWVKPIKLFIKDVDDFAFMPCILYNNQNIYFTVKQNKADKKANFLENSYPMSMVKIPSEILNPNLKIIDNQIIDSFTKDVFFQTSMLLILIHLKSKQYFIKNW